MSNQTNSSPLTQPKSPRRGRTFTGCWTCRSRKVKCDELAPECGPCQKAQISCAGYDSRLVWVTSDQKTYKPHGRRFLNCESTWSGAAPFSSEVVDHFISLSGAAEYVKSTGVEWDPKTKIPFNAFPIRNKSLDSQYAGTPRYVPQSLKYGRSLGSEEAFLFQHYTNHVAVIMMPYEDQRNPWKSEYPAAAMHYISKEQRALYNGLIAQAAVNLAHLGCSQERMLLQAAKHYAFAVRELRDGINNRPEDYASFLAAAMTLMMFEIYNGSSVTWKTHLYGAWKYAQDQRSAEPWKKSAFGWASTQSVCLNKIISDTALKPDQEKYIKHETLEKPLKESLLASVSERDDFGFTAGAPSAVLTCIADITDLAQKIRNKQNTEFADLTVKNILDRLTRSQEMNDKAVQKLIENQASVSIEAKMEYHHNNAFISATYIYLYRSIYNRSPCEIRPYVIQVFINVRAFFECGDGNMTLWPGFIAAVEAYEDSELNAARSWLDTAASVGMGNRLKVQAIVEEVWRERETKARESRRDKGCQKVDWRDVMNRLGHDILLV